MYREYKDAKRDAALIMLLAMAAVVLIFALYVGINETLCARIDAYSVADQSAMKLTAADCKGPWWNRL